MRENIPLPIIYFGVPKFCTPTFMLHACMALFEQLFCSLFPFFFCHETYSATMLTQVSPSGSFVVLSFTTSSPMNRPYPLTVYTTCESVCVNLREREFMYDNFESKFAVLF